MTDSGTFRSSPPRARMASVPVLSGTGGVLVTGICGRLGKQLARALHRDRHVVGVDRRPFHDMPKDITHAQVDIRRKKLKDVFRAGDIEAVAGGALAGGQGAGQDQAGRAEGADGVTEGVVNFPRNSAVNSHNFVV